MRYLTTVLASVFFSFLQLRFFLGRASKTTLFGLEDSQLLRGVHVPNAFDVMQKVSAPKRAKRATKITASAAIKLLRLTGMSPASRLAELKMRVRERFS